MNEDPYVDHGDGCPYCATFRELTEVRVENMALQKRLDAATEEVRLLDQHVSKTLLEVENLRNQLEVARRHRLKEPTFTQTHYDSGPPVSHREHSAVVRQRDALLKDLEHARSLMQEKEDERAEVLVRVIAALGTDFNANASLVENLEQLVKRLDRAEGAVRDVWERIKDDPDRIRGNKIPLVEHISSIIFSRNRWQHLVVSSTARLAPVLGDTEESA